MRRFFYICIVTAVACSLSACSSASHEVAKAKKEGSIPAKTGLFAPNEVGSKRFCSSVDNFCVTFPFIEGPRNFYATRVPASDTPEFRMYSSELAWGYDGTKMVFCSNNIDPTCFQLEMFGSGVPNDSYSVFVSEDVHPSMTLDELDRDCKGWDNRKATPTSLAGRPALHVTCNYHQNKSGTHDIYYVRANGMVYEIGSFDQVHQPFFGQRFFDSFKFIG